jgi:DNA polymerase elongation subunit (family B)
MVRLNKELHFNEALEMFNNIQVATQVAKDLCELYGIEYDENEGRKVRNWLNPKVHLRLREGDYEPKILIYDIETSQAVFKRFWTGKGYLGTRDMIEEPQILTIAYKWFGEDKVHAIEWKNKSDKSLIKEFVDIYNQADLVVGINNNEFDNRWVNARAAKYGFDIDSNIKSFDIQRKAKSKFRLPGYSMEFMCDYFGVPTQKYKHSGINMWNAIENTKGDYSKEEEKEAMAEMVHYNKQDVLATEDLYNRLRPYFEQVTHLGVLKGCTKLSCVECGGYNLKLHKTVITASGIIQRVMKCKDDNVKFKISNRDFLKLNLK